MSDPVSDRAAEIRIGLRANRFLSGESQRPDELLAIYFQEREIFPVTTGCDEVTWGEAKRLSLPGQIELLKKIVNNEHYHQNIPTPTIMYFREALEVIEYIEKNPDKYGKITQLAR